MKKIKEDRYDLEYRKPSPGRERMLDYKFPRRIPTQEFYMKTRKRIKKRNIDYKRGIFGIYGNIKLDNDAKRNHPYTFFLSMPLMGHPSRTEGYYLVLNDSLDTDIEYNLSRDMKMWVRDDDTVH